MSNLRKFIHNLIHSPLITTIIPTYRRPNLLKGAILSALNQTIFDIQVCVYDNASGDETKNRVEEIAKADARVKYYCHSHPIEAAHNFQFGLSAVETPFFSVLADDDLLAPDFYQTALSTLDQFPTASFFLGSTLDVKENGWIISANAMQWEAAKLYEPPHGLYNVIEKYFNWTGALFRQNVLKHAQIDSNIKPIDLDFILRLASQLPFVISKKPCALFIHHKKSYSGTCGHKLVWPSWLKMIQNIESIQDLSESQKSHAKKLMFLKLQHSFFSIAISLISAKQFEQANTTLTLFLNEFPHHRGGKVLYFILPLMKRNRLLFFFFKAALHSYRMLRSLPLLIKYGNFSKNLISQIRTYTKIT